MKLVNVDFASLIASMAIAVLASSVVGCGKDRSNIARVSGDVTIDGTPVPQGSIRFYPAQGRMAIGEIVDGKYTLRTYETDDGAILGKHNVTVKAVETKPKRMPKFNPPPDATPAQLKEFEVEMMEGMGAAYNWIVPESYSRLESSSLTAEVKSGENVINFTLESN